MQFPSNVTSLFLDWVTPRLPLPAVMVNTERGSHYGEQSRSLHLRQEFLAPVLACGCGLWENLKR